MRVLETISIMPWRLAVKKLLLKKKIISKEISFSLQSRIDSFKQLLLGGKQR